MAFFSVKDVDGLLGRAERWLRDLVGSEQCLLWGWKGDGLQRRNGKGEWVGVGRAQGIVGKVLGTGVKDVTILPVQSAVFSRDVDIDTELPLVTGAVKDPESDSVVAVYQFVHVKSFFYNESHKRNNFELEMLDLFCNILGRSLARLYSLN